MAVLIITEMVVERAAAELKAIGAEDVGAGANVIFVNAANEFGLVGELVIGPGYVAAENFGADGAVENTVFPVLSFSRMGS